MCIYIYTIKLHVYCLHASVAGKQCHILLHGSVAVMQSIYTIYFVCQRCWQANYIGLYVSVADKQCHICLYASVAGNQTILACMSALLTSNAISACMPALLASKLYGLVCQRCWQARYCGLYASVAGKQAIWACMPALLASKILWLVCQRCWQASHMCLYAHIPSKHNTNICCCS